MLGMGAWNGCLGLCLGWCWIEIDHWTPVRYNNAVSGDEGGILTVLAHGITPAFRTVSRVRDRFQSKVVSPWVMSDARELLGIVRGLHVDGPIHTSVEVVMLNLGDDIGSQHQISARIESDTEDATRHGWVYDRIGKTGTFVVRRTLSRRGVWSVIGQAAAADSGEPVEDSHAIWADVLGGRDPSSFSAHASVRVERTSWVVHDGDGTVELELVHDAGTAENGDFTEELLVFGRTQRGWDIALEARGAGLLRPLGFSTPFGTGAGLRHAAASDSGLVVNAGFSSEIVERSVEDGLDASIEAQLDFVSAELHSYEHIRLAVDGLVDGLVDGSIDSWQIDEVRSLSRAVATLAALNRVANEPATKQFGGTKHAEEASKRFDELHKRVLAAQISMELAGRSVDDLNPRSSSLRKVKGSRSAIKTFASKNTQLAERAVRRLSAVLSAFDFSGVEQTLEERENAEGVSVESVRSVFAFDVADWRNGRRRGTGRAPRHLRQSLMLADSFGLISLSTPLTSRLDAMAAEEVWQKVLLPFAQRSDSRCNARSHRKLVLSGAMLESSEVRLRNHRKALTREIDRWLNESLDLRGS